MEKIALLPLKTTQDIRGYVQDQMQAGAGFRYSHFRTAASLISHYGEMSPRLAPENREARVFMLSLIAQLTANGLLDRLERDGKVAQVQLQAWLSYWGTQNSSYEGIASQYSLPLMTKPRDGASGRSEKQLRTDAERTIAKVNVLVEKSLEDGDIPNFRRSRHVVRNSW